MKRVGYLAGLAASAALAGGVDISINECMETRRFKYADLCEKEMAPAISIHYNSSKMTPDEYRLFRNPHRKTLDIAVRYGDDIEHDESTTEEEGFGDGLIVLSPFSELIVSNPFSDAPSLCDRLYGADELIITLTAKNTEMSRTYKKGFKVEK